MCSFTILCACVYVRMSRARTEEDDYPNIEACSKCRNPNSQRQFNGRFCVACQQVFYPVDVVCALRHRWAQEATVRAHSPRQCVQGSNSVYICHDSMTPLHSRVLKQQPRTWANPNAARSRHATGHVSEQPMQPEISSPRALYPWNPVLVPSKHQ